MGHEVSHSNLKIILKNKMKAKSFKEKQFFCFDNNLVLKLKLEICLKAKQEL